MFSVPCGQRGYAWEIVPGVTAPSAAAAKLGIGLADGKENIAILAATTDLENVERTIDNHDNTVLMKGAGKWGSHCRDPEKKGLTEKTAAAERCTMEGERLFPDINEMPEDLSYFLTAIIRKGL